MYYNNMQRVNYNRPLPIKKGRQGRSAFTRLRRRMEKYQQNKEKNKYVNHDFCTNCGSTDNIVVDDHSSTIICMDCGMVLEQVMNPTNMRFNEITKSKPYERVVHYQQRLSNVEGRDPWVEERYVRNIEDFLRENKRYSGINLYYAGWQAIKSAVRELGLNPVYSSRWVQIRSRFRTANPKDKELGFIPDRIVNKTKLRYVLFSQAFDKTLLVDDGYPRKNMINLNFVIPSLIRMDCEETFRKIARFFPQNRSQNQPALNNKRMSLIIDYCKEHFTQRYSFKGESIHLEWEFKPLTTEDILNYFICYR